MKKILIALGICFMLACASQHQITDSVNGLSMKNAFERSFTASQFDSICTADSLPTDLLKWQRTAIRDFETREGSYEYLFIKRLGKGEQIYRLEKINDDVYKITKREIK